MEETAALYFVAGYVAFKEKLKKKDNTPQLCEEYSEFLHLVNRGKLMHFSIK